MISIIIPALNEEKVISAALERLNAVASDCEVIVVDNGSVDRTSEIAKFWATVVSSPLGRGPAMNTGAEFSRGDVLLFLHADTLLPAGGIAAIEQALLDPAVIGGYFSLSFDGAGWRTRVATVLYRFIELLGVFYGDAAIFVRRQVFREIGGYGQMPMMEDFDFCLKMRRSGRVAKLDQRVVASSRRWENQGLLKASVVYLLIQGLYLLGVRRHWLYRLYRVER